MTAFADEIIAARTELEGVSPDAWYDRLAAEHERLGTDLEWLRDQDPDRGLRLASIIWPYWVARGHLAEGRRWLEDLLARTAEEPRSVHRTKALYGAGMLAFLQGDAGRARARLEESLAGARELNDPLLEADSLVGLARVAVADQDPVLMEQRALESADAARAGSDERRLGTALHHVAEALRRQGRYDDALPVYRDAIERHRSLGDRRSVALELHNLGHAARQLGDMDTAAERARESLALAVEIKHERLVGYCLLDFAALAVDDGRADRAAQLVGASDTLFAAIGAALDPEYRGEREVVRATAERALGSAAFQREYGAGAAAAKGPDRLADLRLVAS
jgi:non-specific serine/threonine protein kinase